MPARIDFKAKVVGGIFLIRLFLCKTELTENATIPLLILPSLLYFRGAAPSPRSEHAAACHADRYLLIFGGGSHATCFNDLHVLDLQTVSISLF